jgi:hypothetical protein
MKLQKKIWNIIDNQNSGRKEKLKAASLIGCCDGNA